MRVLIVNGYPSTPQGKESFAKFQEIVQEVNPLSNLLYTDLGSFNTKRCSRHTI